MIKKRPQYSHYGLIFYPNTSHQGLLSKLFFLPICPICVPTEQSHCPQALILLTSGNFVSYSNSIITISYLFLFLYISIYLVSAFSGFYACFSWFLNYLVSYQYQEWYYNLKNTVLFPALFWYLCFLFPISFNFLIYSLTHVIRPLSSTTKIRATKLI